MWMKMVGGIMVVVSCSMIGFLIANSLDIDPKY